MSSLRRALARALAGSGGRRCPAATPWLARIAHASCYRPAPWLAPAAAPIRRLWNTPPQWSHGHSHGHSHGGEHDGPAVTITFVQEKDGVSKTVTGWVGMNVLRVAQAHEVELEGACECSLACSTCHVILEEELYNRLGEPSDDENDMLDMAFGLDETSRLGCQVELTEDMDGAVFRIPAATRNMYVDGHVPKPH
jgi:ferredoxin